MRLHEILNESKSTIEIDHDRYDETEELNNKLYRSNWKKLVVSSFNGVFSQLYPGTEINVEDTRGLLRISTGEGDYLDSNDEFIAEILQPGAYIGKDGKIYVGLEIDNVTAGNYKGVISQVLLKVNPELASLVGGSPAFIAPTTDESGGAWERMCRKFGWPYINEVD